MRTSRKKGLVPTVVGGRGSRNETSLRIVIHKPPSKKRENARLLCSTRIIWCTLYPHEDKGACSKDAWMLSPYYY